MLSLWTDSLFEYIHWMNLKWSILYALPALLSIMIIKTWPALKSLSPAKTSNYEAVIIYVYNLNNWDWNIFPTLWCFLTYCDCRNSTEHEGLLLFKIVTVTCWNRNKERERHTQEGEKVNEGGCLLILDALKCFLIEDGKFYFTEATWPPFTQYSHKRVQQRFVFSAV